MTKRTIGTLSIIAGMVLATLATEQKFGLLPLLGLPEIPAIILAYLLLEMTVYLQHLIFHASPVLWRLHKVHHSDPDLDVTSGLRFHPIEIFLSLFIKSVMVLAFGAPPLAVLLFEVLLNAGSLFNHSNINIPEPVDRLLRLLIVTPDMHRIHHSTVIAETNSNFSFTLSLWDRIFGTYRRQPGVPQTKLRIGLTDYPDAHRLGLLALLRLPFLGGGERYSLNAPEENQEQQAAEH